MWLFIHKTGNIGSVHTMQSGRFKGLAKMAFLIATKSEIYQNIAKIQKVRFKKILLFANI
jgi:hypothetical protein